MTIEIFSFFSSLAVPFFICNRELAGWYYGISYSYCAYDFGADASRIVSEYFWRAFWIFKFCNRYRACDVHSFCWYWANRYDFKTRKSSFSFVGNSEFRQMLAILLIVAPISGFINNTAAVAILLPMVLDLARRSGTPATNSSFHFHFWDVGRNAYSYRNINEYFGSFHSQRKWTSRKWNWTLWIYRAWDYCASRWCTLFCDNWAIPSSRPERKRWRRRTCKSEIFFLRKLLLKRTSTIGKHFRIEIWRETWSSGVETYSREKSYIKRWQKSYWRRGHPRDSCEWTAYCRIDSKEKVKLLPILMKMLAVYRQERVKSSRWCFVVQPSFTTEV